jgi:AAA domain
VATPATTRKDYQAIAKRKIRDPGSTYLRWLIYARYKIGKTHFLGTVPPKADGSPNVLVIDAEQGHGSKALVGKPVKVWPIGRWEDTAEVEKALRAGLDFEYIAFDNFSRIANMALRRVMRLGEERDLDRPPGIVDRRDYGKSGELLKGLLFNLHTLPYNFIYTAGDRMETGGGWNDAEDDDTEAVVAQFVPDLPKGPRAALNQIVDVIGRMYVVKTKITHPKTKKEVEIRQRRLWLQPNEQYDTGYRSPHKLPDYLKAPTVPRLEKLIKEGVV